MGRAATFEKSGEECKFHLSREAFKNDLDMMVFTRNSIFRHQINNGFVL